MVHLTLGSNIGGGLTLEVAAILCTTKCSKKHIMVRDSMG